MDIIEEAFSHIQQDEVTSLLQNLIRIPSSTGQEGQVQALVKDRFAAAGLEVETFEANFDELRDHPEFSAPRLSFKKGYAERPNVVGHLPGVGGGSSLLLFCHADTIPPGAKSAWSRDPFGGEIEGNRLYGRGASDAKSGLAIMIACAKVLRDKDIKLKGDLTLLSTIEEEGGGGGGMLSSVLRGINADAAAYVHMKPAGFKGIEIGSCGNLGFKITVPGQFGSVASSHIYVNAIEKAENITKTIRELDSLRGSQVNDSLVERRFSLVGLLPRTVRVLVTSIYAGEDVRQMPPECILKGIASIAPKENPKEIRKLVEKHIAMAIKADLWLNDHPPLFEWIEPRSSPSLTDPNHPFVKLALSVAERITGFPSQLTALAGTTDLRFPILYGNTPTIMFGGNRGPIHVPDEYAYIDELLLSVKALLWLVIEWCGVD
jgi:acetylornithine deacetylase